MDQPKTDGIDGDQVLLDLLLSPEGRKDPYPRYAALREGTPVLQSKFGPVVLSRYEDCQHALRDPKLGRGVTDGIRPDLPEDMVARMKERQSRSMLFANPPDHTRLRRLVSREFTPGRVGSIRPAIEATVDALYDEMAEKGEVDIMTALAFPVPVTVIGELLGIPKEDRLGFQPLVRKVVTTLELNIDEATFREAEAASLEMGAYFAELLAERRAHPRDDLLSALAVASDADDRLSEEEVIVTAILLFAAGFETTTNLIGNGLYALLTNPDQLRRFRDDLTLAPSAVEEMLRWDSPVQLNGRVALEDAEVAGVKVKKGGFVMCLQGAANRDSERFSEPELFDVARNEGPPLSFGSGIHYCLGAGLARAEGEIVFRRMLERFSEINLVGPEPELRPGLTLRGLAALPVELTTARGNSS